MHTTSSTEVEEVMTRQTTSSGFNPAVTVITSCTGYSLLRRCTMTETLPTLCAAADLLPTPCAGPLHRHHVYPISRGGDELGRTVILCARHHPSVEAIARRLLEPRPRRCPHRHRTREAREACERRLSAI